MNRPLLPKSASAALCLATVLGALHAAPAEAGPIGRFDPTGQGDAGAAFSFGGLDWAPGNALAVAAQPIAPGRNTFTTFFQTTLEAFLDPAGNPIPLPGLGNQFQITVQGAIPETASVTGNTILFGHDDAGPDNFIRLYFNDSVTADAQTGVGFDDGTLIMDGEFTANDTFFTFDPNSVAPLDGFDGDDQPGYGSIVGSGSGPIIGEVGSTDPAYFIDDDLFHFVLETLQTAPFTAVEPTGPATADPVDGGVVGVVPGFSGSIPGLPGVFPNGISGLPNGCSPSAPCDVMLQTEVTMQFVSEPAGLGLGAGLVALGLLMARRRLARAGAC